MSMRLSDDEIRKRLDANSTNDHLLNPAVLDPTGHRRRLVLLGAGASVEAGLPAATDLLEEMVNLTHLRLLRAIAENGTWDLERCVQLLEVFSEGKVEGSLGSILLQMGHFSTLQNVTKGRIADQAEEEYREILDHIRQRYWLRDASKVGYLEPLIKAQWSGTVATLNYDNTLTLAGSNSWDGSPGQAVSLVKYSRRDMLRVLHLHGSIGWEVMRDPTRDLKVVMNRREWQDPSDRSLPYSPAIVFGAGNKLRSYGPYLALLGALQEELSITRTLITIGYSWRDPHINDLIRSWATASEDNSDEACSKRLIVGLGPASRDLPGEAYALKRDHHAQLEVRPVRGLASSVIADLFGPGAEFGVSLLESFMPYWCSG